MFHIHVSLLCFYCQCYLVLWIYWFVLFLCASVFIVKLCWCILQVSILSLIFYMSRHVDLNVRDNRSKNAIGRDFIVLLCSWHRSCEVTLFCVPMLFYVIYCFAFVLLCFVFTVDLFCFVLVTLSLSRVGCLCYASLYCVRDIIPCECLCNIVVYHVSLWHFAHTRFAFLLS